MELIHIPDYKQQIIISKENVEKITGMQNS